MFRAIIAIAAIGLASPAYSQALPAPVDGSYFCRSGARALLDGASVDTALQECKPGDTISMAISQGTASTAIGRFCDFSKTIVMAGTQVVCVIAGDRKLR